MTDDEIVEHGEKCPVCGTAWSTVARIVHGGHWVHCVPCEKKAETIKEEEKERRDNSYKNMKEELDAMSYNYGSIDWGHKK